MYTQLFVNILLNIHVHCNWKVIPHNLWFIHDVNTLEHDQYCLVYALSRWEDVAQWRAISYQLPLWCHAAQINIEQDCNSIFVAVADAQSRQLVRKIGLSNQKPISCFLFHNLSLNHLLHVLMKQTTVALFPTQNFMSISHVPLFKLLIFSSS